jgi:hypothetical protein
VQAVNVGSSEAIESNQNKMSELEQQKQTHVTLASQDVTKHWCCASGRGRCKAGLRENHVIDLKTRGRKRDWTSLEPKSMDSKNRAMIYNNLRSL